jgi:hypothetical protein
LNKDSIFIQDILATYFAEMSQILERNEGLIDKVCALFFNLAFLLSCTVLFV